jgi:hypothetical protein
MDQAAFKLSLNYGRPLLALVSALALGGCIETYVAHEPDTTTKYFPARREGVSPQAATVALSVGGVPQDVETRFKNTFENEARAREITLSTSRTSAHYLINVFLNPHPVEDAKAIDFVLYVFDANKNNTQRLDDTIIVKNKADSPLTSDDIALKSVAAKSAEYLAAFLTNTPEAIAASPASKPSVTTTATERTNEGETIVSRSAEPNRTSSNPPSTVRTPGLGIAGLRE